MTKKNVFAALVFTGLFCAVFMSSCHHDQPPPEPLEPISLVQPDTPIVWLFADSVQRIQIKFTTDRPIDSILGVFDIDSLVNSTDYVPTYPYILFDSSLVNLNPRVNLFTYTGSYTVPGNLVPFSIIRFRISYVAGSNTVVVGQNYPQGIDTASKTFTINVQ